MPHAQSAPPVAATQPAPGPVRAAQSLPAARPASASQPPPPTAERYRDRLLRYVNRLTAGDAHRAEDIVQETMLRAWLAADQFSDEESGSCQSEDHLAAWLHTVARNLAVDARRRDRTVPMGIMPAALLHRVADGSADMANTVVDRVALVRLLARLPAQHRDVVVHVHLCDRSRAETARLLAIPSGTVKSRLHYALSTLRGVLPAV